jgi:uncharacterized protein YbcV (DUF1398 family)
MDTQLIHATTQRITAGTISYPEVVRQLLTAGVEFYRVDYLAREKSYYATDGLAKVTVPLEVDGLPTVPPDFDAATVKAAILDSQLHGQPYVDFSRRVMAAGVQGYFAFLRGKRVTYFGRAGDAHTEWFPGAEPAARH